MEQPKRVLVVEDDAHIADLICLHLRDEQFEVVHSADLVALEAVEEARRVARQRIVLKENSRSREFARLGFSELAGGRYSHVHYGIMRL